MFGFVRPFTADLSENEKKRYRAFYCGLCRKLQEKYGYAGRLGLNYDMTFLTVFLSSLYEPEERTEPAVCPPHPLRRHQEAVTAYTEYAADMTVIMTYHKALDDWEDERKAFGRAFSGILRKHYDSVREKYPRLCEQIEENLKAIRAVESAPDTQAEQAADAFGRMLGTVFAPEEGFFREEQYRFGYCLGKFVYMMDAAVDYERDGSRNCFNPLIRMGIGPEEAGELLRQPLGCAAEIFEKLPLVQDADLMRNILYSGVWQTYNAQMKKRAGETDGR